MALSYSRKRVCVKGKAGEETTTDCWWMPTGKHTITAYFPPPDAAIVIARLGKQPALR